jgi:hypothetical protein
MNKEDWRQVEQAQCSGRGITRGCWRRYWRKQRCGHWNCSGNLPPLQGPLQRPLPAALSGSLNKAPGFAGGYLLDSSLKNVKQNDFNNEVAASGCGEQIDDILDGLVSAMIGGFESAVWAMLRVWSVVEAAVGKRSAQPFVEEQK